VDRGRVPSEDGEIAVIAWDEHLWAVVLEAPEPDETNGAEPLGLSVFAGGDDRGRSVLRRAVDAVLRLAAPERVVAVVHRERRDAWERELLDLPIDNVLTEPTDRGTAPRVLLPLLHVLGRDPGARLLVVSPRPGFEDPEVLRHAIERVLLEDTDDGDVVMLGATPECARPGVDYLMPRVTVTGREELAGIERPLRATRAAAAIARGGMLDTGVVVGRASLLHELYRLALPRLIDVCALAVDSAVCRAWVLDYVYQDLPHLDLARHVLLAEPELVRLARVDGRVRVPQRQSPRVALAGGRLA
jgi:mannose-1-phosphate guanylyltransferase